ncbi:MAG: PmoA family protein [Verrucomicrobia bacterium]|nr:PmoA family protein [Verrucomicrobiota bacterium]
MQIFQALFHSQPPAVLLVSLATANAETSFTVHAGDYDRHETAVAFPAPPSLRGSFLLKDSTGATVTMQVDAAGRGAFIEPKLARGESKTYKLGSAIKSIAHVVAQKDGSVVKLTAGNKNILHYQMQAGPVPAGVSEIFSHGAHLHPVFSPGGHLVTGNHPSDHRWHRGIWFAWTDTEFEGRHPDFWNQGKGSGPDKSGGKLEAEVRFDRLAETWSGPVHAGFVSLHRLIDHSGGADKDVLKETWTLTAFRPAGADKSPFLFDLVSTQTCASDSPLKLPKYHYGGLGVRGNALWDPVDNVTMLTSEGHARKDGDATKGKWVHLGGDVDGEPTGLAVLIHPDNFRFPQPLRLNPKNPQLCIAPSQDGDWEITPAKPYVSRYRFIIADGKPEAKELDRLWNDYAHPPVVDVNPR